jgi:SAM-dependent methyltransferase
LDIREEEKQNKGILQKLNDFYSKYIDSRILSSVFSGGGVGFIKSNRKIREWIDLYVKNKPTLFIEPEDNRLVDYIGPENCLTIGDLAFTNVFPSEDNYPNLSASPEQLPIKSSSFESILSNFVLEHIVQPRNHIHEIHRILKPGGYAIIGGPGDIYPSHRVPFNFFNIIRFGYYEMFRENDLELIEEYFPSKSWMSILYLIYNTTVRNSWFNRNQFTKLFHMIVFGISLFIFPLLNLLALILDMITPFDKRCYSIYITLVRKPLE